MFNLLFVALGGALGSTGRYLVGHTIAKSFGGELFPLATLVVNLLGCFVIGVLSGAIS